MQGSDETARRSMVYVGIGLVFALALASYLVYQIAVVVLVLLLTLLFSVIISGPVDYLEHQGIGRGLGTLVVLGGLILYHRDECPAHDPEDEDKAAEDRQRGRASSDPPVLEVIHGAADDDREEQRQQQHQHDDGDLVHEVAGENEREDQPDGHVDHASSRRPIRPLHESLLRSLLCAYNSTRTRRRAIF